MKKTAIVAIVVLTVLASCRYGYQGPDRPVKPTDTDSCEAGCARLKELECPGHEGSDPGDPESCKNDCEYIQGNGVALSPSCWAEMKSCDELETACSR